jgi:translocation and assembly module TamB
MANLPNSTPPEPPESPHRGAAASVLLKIGAGLGVAALAGGVAVIVWGDRLIERYILPRVEEEIAKTIGRPIDLGNVEGLALWGIRLGDIVIPPTATDESTVTVDEADLDITLRSLLFQQVIGFDLRLVRPQVLLVQGADAKWIDLVVPEPSDEESRIGLEIQSLTVEDASLTALTRIQDPMVAIARDPVEVEGVDVVANFRGEEDRLVDFDVNGEVATGQFALMGEADLADKAVQTNVRLQDLPVTGLNLLLPTSLGIRAGVLNTNLTIAADLTAENALNLDAVDVQGTARFREGEVVVNGLPAPVQNIRSQLRFQGQQVTLEETGLQLEDIRLTAAGTVDVQEGYDLTAQIPQINLADVQSLAEIDLPVEANGAFQLDAQVTGELLDPQVTGRLANRQPVQVDQVIVPTLVADFALNQARFDLRELRIVPDAGGVVLAQGQADITDLTDPTFQLTAQIDVPVDPFTELYGVTLPAETVIGSLTADVTAEGNLDAQTAFAQWQLSASSFPGSGDVTLADNRIVADNTRLQVAEGTVTATAIAELATGNWQATATTSQVPIQQFTDQAQGLLTANLNAAGNLSDFDLATIQAGGDATIADAVVQLTPTSAPLLPPGDWNTAFEWQGDRLAINTFTAPNLQADGFIGVNFDQAIPIGDVALNVDVRDFDLRPLNSLAPAPVQEYAQLAGLTSFSGQISGNWENPQIAGNARLVDLALNQFAFEPLAGPVALSLAEGGEVDLRGPSDRIQLAVNADPWPTTFEIRNSGFVASGYGEGRQLYADIEQFPLAELNVQPLADYGFGTVTGIVNVSIDADLTDFNNPLANGTLTVTEPGLDPIAAELITADFRYTDNVAVLNQGELQLANSRFLLTARAALQPEIEYQGELTIAEGQIEDLVAIAQAIDLSAFGLGGITATPTGTAADLATTPVGLPMASFLEQLVAFVAFERSLPDTPADEGRFAIPPLDTLTGQYTGAIAFAGTTDFDDLTAEATLEGDSWEWGPYAPPNQFLMSGAVNSATVTLDPVIINAGDTVVNLTGSGNLNRLQGELLVDDVPVELVEAVYELPVSIAGDLDLATQFGGSLTNPIVEGEVLVANPVVNEQPLAQVGAEFDYRNATLTLDGAAAIAPDESPITLEGTVPYALPFMTVQPPTDQLAVNAVVPSDAFDFVNVLTDDLVRWEQGDGEVVVQVGGTLADPVVAGSASFQDGVVSSTQLGDPITNLNGDIQFNLERIGIQQLQANLGDGKFEVSGRLPLLPSGESILALAQTQPAVKQNTDPVGGIQISLEELPLDIAGILQAVLNGQVAIAGAVLEPTIGGGIELDEGRIQANELLRQAGAIDLPSAETLAAINPYRADYLGLELEDLASAERPEGFIDKVTLQDFTVVFSDRLVIAGQPFYNITADGGITVNGPLPEMKPDGQITLQSGWINLFSTQFRLDQNEPNSAVFTPEDGLDPYVDVVLTARVQETDVTPVPPSSDGFASSEISDNNVESLGQTEFINVQAVAEGYASNLQNSLALTSRPSRSQEELVALLGSNVAGGLAGSSLTQFAGFLGAGSLAGFGNDLANTLGLQSFSVFPTTDTSEESNAGVGIGVEASFAIGSNIGVNILEILDSGNPPQLGVLYRFTDELELRGSSNLDNSEVRLEYRTDF